MSMDGNEANARNEEGVKYVSMDEYEADASYVEGAKYVSMDECEVNARNAEGAKYVSMDEDEADARNVRKLIISSSNIRTKLPSSVFYFPLVGVCSVAKVILGLLQSKLF